MPERRGDGPEDEELDINFCPDRDDFLHDNRAFIHTRKKKRNYFFRSKWDRTGKRGGESRTARERSKKMEENGSDTDGSV